MASLKVTLDSATNRVRGVDLDGLGAKLGIRVGDVLVDINSTPIATESLASILDEIETIDSVVVGRASNKVRLSETEPATVVGTFTSETARPVRT